MPMSGEFELCLASVPSHLKARAWALRTIAGVCEENVELISDRYFATKAVEKVTGDKSEPMG